jgi:flotillin
MTSLLLSLLLLGGGTLALRGGLRSTLAICQPNQALVIYGLPGRRGYRLLKGGSSLLMPLLEDVHPLDLGNRNIPIQIQEALTATGIRISVEAVANVKIAGHEPVIHGAVERLLDRTDEAVNELARLTLESNLRGVLATLTPEQVNADTEAFARALMEEAGDDLSRLGLELDSLQITALRDNVGYLTALGRPQQVALLRQSRIAEAEARAEARIEAVEQEKTTRLVQLDRDEALARAEAHRRIQEAQTRQEAQVAEAEAQIAGELSRVEAELPLQQARLTSVARQLQADVVAPAEAAYQEALAQARAGAAGIRADGDAQTEALRALMDSLLAAGPEARSVYLMPRLQPLLALLREAVPPLQVQELRLIGEQAAGPASLPALLARLQAATDVDLGRWIRPKDPPAGTG